MELTVRMSKRGLALIGAILAVLAGAAAARLLPTDYTGALTTQDPASGGTLMVQRFSEPTSLSTYALCAVAALALYAAVLCVAQVRRPVRR